MRLWVRRPGIPGRIRVPITHLMASPLRFCASKLTRADSYGIQPDPKMEEPDISRYRKRWYGERDPIEVATECLGFIASRSSEYFRFKKKNPAAGPHIRDLLKIKDDYEGDHWEYITHEEDGYDHVDPSQPTDPHGDDPCAMMPLPCMFDAEEWAFIEKMLSYVEANDRSKLNPDNFTKLRSLKRRRC